MFLVNGEYKHCIDVTDRGFHYGDGLFETIEINNGSPVFLQRHLARLQTGCKRLLIPFPDIRLLTDEIFRLIDNTPQGVLKLMLTRGSGGRGYRQPEIVDPTRVLSLHPYPDYPLTLNETGINARFCDYRLGINPYLAGLKHMNRLEQVMARAEWSESDIQEGIMMDINNHVVEGTMSNLFCVKDQLLVTPKLDVNGIEGIIRSIILQFVERIGLEIEIVRLTKTDILAADELFVTNSIIGIWPIKQMEQQIFPVGPVTKRISVLLDQCKQQDMETCCYE